MTDLNETSINSVEAISYRYYNYVALIIILGILIIGKPRKKVDNKNRKLGQWTAEDYKPPSPAPYPNWDLNKTGPLPYRAFKHKYNITMGIRNMDWSSWFEIDNQWFKFHREKLNRLEKYDTSLYETTKEALPAAYELLEEMREYLPKRYPSMFESTEYGIHNKATDEDVNFMGKYRNFNPAKKTGVDPMKLAALLVQDDLAIMMESKDGQYILKGGAIILPGFWKFRDKFNMTLENIHTSGDVPKFKEKLQSGMEKFFVRLTCDKPVVRNNYFLQTDDQLGWSVSIGNEFKGKVGWGTADEATEIEKIHLRSERQSLRRLPKSGAIIFTVRTYFIPITEIVKEPFIPRRLLNGILSWEEDVQDYRGFTKFKDVLLPYLEEKALEQERLGFLPEEGPNVFPF
ncbi:hypothetical protein CLIB1444_08S05402 [[Candida] jaroonii]|uniref:Uncharacterized protein n=1 Tax=[Candida] jaroonii TaxID=467808 RepID=A0ACA9YBK9_9ASCO|nr:hypothetical protein CLIB1444_08S05402 [[Candida] jaroonii]